MDNEFANLTEDELFALARRANQEVFARAVPIVRRVARKCCRQYSWIDADDLAGSMLQEVPRIAYNYDENAASEGWSKYLYFRLGFVARDCLRKEDPLGICWPQKKAYPQWHRLGDESLSGFVVPDTQKDDEPDNAGPDQFATDLQDLRDYFADVPLPREMKPTHWDKNRRRVRFRGGRCTRLAHWVKEYRSRRGNPNQMQLELQ